MPVPLSAPKAGHNVPDQPPCPRPTAVPCTAPHRPPRQVIDGTMVKIYAWYDNEFGYSARLVDLAQLVASRL